MLTKQIKTLNIKQIMFLFKLFNLLKDDSETMYKHGFSNINKNVIQFKTCTTKNCKVNADVMSAVMTAEM